MIQAQFYFLYDEHWSTEIDGVTTKIQMPKIGDKIEHKGKVYEVVDIDEEHGIFDIYLN